MILGKVDNGDDEFEIWNSKSLIIGAKRKPKNQNQAYVTRVKRYAYNTVQFPSGHPPEY